MKTSTTRRMMQSAGIAILAAAMFAAPASAGKHAKKKQSCFWQAELVRPALRQPEKEAFIANCKADLTATSGKRRRGDY